MYSIIQTVLVLCKTKYVLIISHFWYKTQYILQNLHRWYLWVLFFTQKHLLYCSKTVDNLINLVSNILELRPELDVYTYDANEGPLQASLSPVSSHDRYWQNWLRKLTTKSLGLSRLSTRIFWKLWLTCITLRLFWYNTLHCIRSLLSHIHGFKLYAN